MVVVLVMMLASVATPPSPDSVQRTREATLKEDLFRVRDAIDQYHADKNRWPSALQDLVGEGYLREIPKDPFTNSADTWQVDNAPPDPNNPAGEPGIDNVHSGSEETALDGTKYSEWD